MGKHSAGGAARDGVGGGGGDTAMSRLRAEAQKRSLKTRWIAGAEFTALLWDLNAPKKSVWGRRRKEKGIWDIFLDYRKRKQRSVDIYKT